MSVVSALLVLACVAQIPTVLEASECNQPAVCPQGLFTLVPGVGCYMLMYNALDWPTQQRACAAVTPGARTVVVTSQAQDDAIRALINSAKTATCCNGYWTSGRRATDSCNSPFNWRPDATTFLPLTYTNWEVKPYSQPDCFAGVEYCLNYNVESVPAYLWNDVSCSNTMCAVCEIPGDF